MSLNIGEDKEYEEYWLYLKEIFYRNVSSHVYQYISDCSIILNDLKSKKMYTEIISTITLFLKTHACKIICMFFVKLNYNDIHLLNVYLRRWHQYDPEYKLEFIEYDLLKVISTYIHKKHGYYVISPIMQSYFMNCLNVKKYDIGCLNQCDFNVLNKCCNNIIINSVENNNVAIIDVMTKYIDITLYFPKGTDKKYKTIKSRKLFKLIKSGIL